MNQPHPLMQCGPCNPGGAAPLFHEFKIDRVRLLFGASIGLALLIFSVWASWQCWTFHMSAEAELPLFDDDKPSLLLLGGFGLLIVLALGFGGWALGIAWRQWFTALELHDEGIVSYDRSKEQTIRWSEIASIYEQRSEVAPMLHGPLQFLMLPFQDVRYIHTYIVRLKAGTELMISGMRGQSLLVGLLAVHAQKHNILWEISRAQR